MGERLRQLRLRSVRRRAGHAALAAVGAVATLGAVPLLFLQSPAANAVFALVCVAAAAHSGFRALPKDEVTVVHPRTRAEITISRGDLFAVEDEPIVVTVNTHFDIATGTRTLMRQLVDRWCDGDPSALRAALAIPDGDKGRSEQAPVGSIEEVTLGGRSVLLLAVSQRDPTSESKVVVNDVWQSLSRLWDRARAAGWGRISLPLIGSGMSNARVDGASLLVLLISSYVADAHERPGTCPIQIVLHGRPGDVLALSELAVSFSTTLGFSED